MRSYQGHVYQPFFTQNIIDNSRTDFDVFVEVDQQMILYSGIHYRWNRDELTALIEKGYQNLFIKTKDDSKAKTYQAISKIPKIDASLPPKERIISIEQVGMHFVKTMHAENISAASIDKADQISQAIVSCIGEDPKSIQHLSGLGDFDLYTYFHSVRVACYSVAIAQQMGMSSQADLGAIGLGCLMHDIGKKEIDLAILNKNGALTKQEWEAMRSHPIKGHKLVEESLLQQVPREIILHHHEKANGQGYPHGLDKHSLIDEVQIATIGDIFDALTSSRSYQNKRSRYEALQFMKHKMVGNEVSIDAFKALVQALNA